jgi:hypothetical protein
LNAVLTAALGYARQGWPVFLLGRSKRPLANCPNCPSDAKPGTHDPQGCRCLTCHGFYAATLDPKAIQRMLALTPYGMLAIRTGAASGLVVVDVDPDKGGMASLTTLVRQALTPPTRFVRTGSGGLHLYYRHPGPHTKIRCSQSEIAPGIDIKADGGYVVAPPSVHPRTRIPYAWAGHHAAIGEMPPALRQACLKADQRPAPDAVPRSTTSLRSAGGISHPDLLLATLLDRVRTAPEGRRRATLYGCARGVARMVTSGAINPAEGQAALLEVGLAAGQTERECRTAIHGGFTDEGVSI